MGVLSFTRYNQKGCLQFKAKFANIFSLNYTVTFRFPFGKFLNCDFRVENRIRLQNFCILHSFEIYCPHLLIVCQ